MSHAEKIIKVFNDFDGQNLTRLDTFYAADVVFEDPVTRIEGLKELKKYYSHAYKNVISIRFEFGAIFNNGDDYAAPWTMHLAVKGLNKEQPYSVKGLSHLKFNSSGLVAYHRDYVDLGDMVYERIPLIGAGVRKLKKFLAP